MKDLSNVPGIDNTDPNYVNGKVVELVTLVKEDIHQDIIQFFQKIMDLESIVANDNQDNEANGYQTLQAMVALINSEAYTKTESNDRFLEEAENLADLDNPTTARTNLDVFSKSETSGLISNNVKLGGGVTSAGAIDGNIKKLGSWTVAKSSTGVYTVTHTLGTQDLIIIATASSTDQNIVADVFNKTNTSFRLLVRDTSGHTVADGSFNFIALQ